MRYLIGIHTKISFQMDRKIGMHVRVKLQKLLKISTLKYERKKAIYGDIIHLM